MQKWKYRTAIRFYIALGLVFAVVDIGQLTSDRVPNERTLADLPEDVRDFWGYKRLAEQVGQRRAYIVASLIEGSSYPELIRGIITVESGWDIRAQSNRSALGLMQIRMIAAREMEPDITSDQLFDPVKNVDIGIRIFERHMHYFDQFVDSEHWALTAYNRGRSATFSLGARPPMTSYSLKVLGEVDKM